MKRLTTDVQRSNKADDEVILFRSLLSLTDIGVQDMEIYDIVVA